MSMAAATSASALASFCQTDSAFVGGGPPLHPVGTAEKTKCSADHGAADMRSDRFCLQFAEVTGDELRARIVFLQDWLAQHAK
jgi:hypothetical protein